MLFMLQDSAVPHSASSTTKRREQLSIKCCCAAKKEEIQLHGVGVGKSHSESSAAGSNETQNRVEDINYNSARSDYDIHL